MAKWDLSKLPEGRKPLPDKWFAERAQMQDRIKELEKQLRWVLYERDATFKSMLNRAETAEGKLATAWDAQTVKILIKTAYKEGWADGGDNVPLGSGWEKSHTKATLAELTGDKDE